MLVQLQRREVTGLYLLSMLLGAILTNSDGSRQAPCRNRYHHLRCHSLHKDKAEKRGGSRGVSMCQACGKDMMQDMRKGPYHS